MIKFKGRNLYCVMSYMSAGDGYMFYFGADTERIADLVGRRICLQLGFSYHKTILVRANSVDEDEDEYNFF